MKKSLPSRALRRGILFSAAFLSAGIVLAVALWKTHGGPLIFLEESAATWRLSPTKDAYFHDEFVEWTLQTADQDLREALLKSTDTPKIGVERNGVPVTTIGELRDMAPVYDKARKDWRGRWPVPWNAPDGEYALRLDTGTLPGGGSFSSAPFQIVSRSFDPVPAGFGVLTLEGLTPLQKFTGPEGGTPTVKAMAEWADFMGADAVLIQGAESSGYTAKPSAAFPWQMRSASAVSALAAECRRRGMRLGVYVLCYMVGGPPQFSPDYDYGWHYDGRAIHGLDLPQRRGVSIADERRAADIVKVLDRWAAVDGVDFLGLDYIRPVFGGNELMDDFAREMPGVSLPPGFGRWTKEERMRWVARARHLAPRADQRNEPRYRLTDQWFWYRAHRTAQAVRRIAAGVDEKKPLWAFTLSWQKGWEHGQDPAMMRDAGVDMDAIMLYEADDAQYRGLVNQWNNYAGRDQLNLVVGNIFDWRLHQKTKDPAGPEAMVDRILLAVEKFHKDGPVRGVFVHDLLRGLRGNLGPYGPREWFLAAGAALTRLREKNGVLPYDLRLDVPREARPKATLTGTVGFGPRRSSETVVLRLHSAPDLEVSPRDIELTPEKSSVTIVMRWRPNGKSAARGHRTFVALRAERPGRAKERCQILQRYIQGRFEPGEEPAGEPGESGDTLPVVGTP